MAIRLCVVTETYVPDINGVANSLRDLIRSLDPEKYELQMIRTAPKAPWQGQCEEVLCKGVSIPMYPDLQIGLPAKRRIQTAWDAFKPDVVYIATEGFLGYSALNEAKRRNLPVLSAFHTNFHRYGSYYGLGWVKHSALAWLRRFHNRTQGTIVPSQDIANDLVSDGFLNVRVIPHGVDCTLFNPNKRSESLRKQWGVDADDTVLLYVGRVAAEKNIPLAVKAFRALQTKQSHVRMVVVGDGPLLGELRQNNPDIVFAGLQKGDELAAHYASADAFVFPSLTETFGLVTLEAMASGLPVVAYNMAAAKRYVRTGQHGVLAQVENTDTDLNEAFVQALQTLMQYELNALQHNARVCAEHLSWDAVASQLNDLVHNTYSQWQEQRTLCEHSSSKPQKSRLRRMLTLSRA